MFLPRRPSSAIAALALCLTLVGCTADQDPAPEAPTSTGSRDPADTTSSIPPTSPPTADPTSEPTADPTSEPSVAPSTGTELSIPGATLRGPRGWTERQEVSSAVAGWINLDDLSSVLAGSTLENAPTRPTTDTLVESVFAVSPRFTQRLDDLMVAGEPAYRVEGTEDGDYITDIGFVHDDRSLSISFTFRPGFKNREDVIASVLASIELD